VQSLARRLERGGVVSAHSVTAGAQPFLAVCLKRLLPRRPIVVVTPNLKSQEAFEQDLMTWSGAVGPAGLEDPLFYAPWAILPHEARLPHADVISDRLGTLVSLMESAAQGPRSAPVILSSVEALLQRTFHPGDLRLRTRTFRRGDRIDPLELMEWLEAQGYEPEAQVTQKGDIALRGGILDVYPLTGLWPFRLEFFGDELESLRTFDPLTQISRDPAETVILPPGGELGILKRKLEEAASSAPDAVAVRLGTLLDYLPREAVFLLAEPEQIRLHAEDYARQVPPDDVFFTGWDQFLDDLDGRGMARLDMTEEEASAGGDAGHFGAIETLRFSSLDPYRPLTDRAPDPLVADTHRREFFAQIHRWLRQGRSVHVFCNNEGERHRFLEIWRDYGLADTQSGSPDLPEDAGARLSTHVGSLGRGFVCEPANVVVITDAEIFGRYKIQRPRRLKSAGAPAARSALDMNFTELEEGDLVVHLQHGIGRYLGLRTLPMSPRRTAGSSGPGAGPSDSEGTECLVLEFAPGDAAQQPPKLYVPVTEAHLVSKYVGAGKARPPLNTLGGGRWAKAVEQAERAVRDVAADLLAIQAARESQAGHSCSVDTPWQREFESAFLFEETPDQAQAIQETKADMEQPKPMDRLICGDVGFGKTEVAIRAAFKSAMDGKQVAVLVPTTVLAQQHYNTFRERMADYPVRIELLSRFRSRREQTAVVRDLAAGAVDIVIGTHRLLQDDVVFKDLGLVVIDEEQRFGVMHKEKFKMLRRLVDVLTLSATPIPRTLYLALSGARDMSTIQTPPHDRLPVETLVVQYDERVIRDAIQRELNRGGQVFFLHNRVLTIHTMEQRLRGLVPGARIVVGHGQMDSDELEEVMTRFVNGEADVLLSTTIIESGLDIPNANTIIIDRADRFGLSDLYQLRGRVGRYKHQAYAYLLLPRHAGLLADARRRIGAIKQYSTLGSGFKIAMRDLEIRGAGNLLGSEQSGHITAVGFELYCQLLKQSVAVLRGERPKPRVDVQVRLDFLELRPAADGSEKAGAGSSASARATSLAFIPHGYAPEPRHRIEIYRKIAQAGDSAALAALGTELRDRFGAPPAPVELLLQVAALKILAAERGISSIEVVEDKLMLTRQGDFITLGGKFPRLTKKQAPARLKEIKRLLLAL
jgi:transcription-repair coupling factor (superfamily II helicase)